MRKNSATQRDPPARVRRSSTTRSLTPEITRRNRLGRFPCNITTLPRRWRFRGLRRTKRARARTNGDYRREISLFTRRNKQLTLHFIVARNWQRTTLSALQREFCYDIIIQNAVFAIVGGPHKGVKTMCVVIINRVYS